MEEERPWASLPAELVSLITGPREMSLVDYTSIRSTCWRSTMPPATPLLIYTAASTGPTPYDPVFFAAAYSLPAQRQLEARDCLDPVLTNGSICVGSGSGWLAFDDERIVATSRRLILMNPISGLRISLPELMKDTEWKVKKVVFAPKPSAADFTAVAIYGLGDYWRVAYARSGDNGWTELPKDRRVTNTIVDLVYHDDGKVYGLTISSTVRVIHLPGCGGGGGETQAARVESLLHEGDGSSGLPLDPATVFEVPRFRLLSYTRRGNNDNYLVFCEGNMYQVWRNLCSTRRAALFGGLQKRELRKEIIVLKHEPGSWPCWREVNDLGGCSVFIGKNNAVSVRVAGKPWLKPDCVYWIGGREEERAMVFDMATKITTPCVPNDRLEGFAQWACCWYFLK